MQWQITTQVREGYIFAKPSGPISIANLITLLESIRDECNHWGMRCGLVDCIEIQGALSIEQLDQISPEFVRILEDRLKIAYMNPPPHWISRDDEFSRAEIGKRGGFLELFISEEAALMWLLGK
jgi:hypothetical protein